MSAHSAERDAATREDMARAWDEALTHVWALNDPAYTILTDTESIHPLLTRNDVEQARHENPYRVIPPEAFPIVGGKTGSTTMSAFAARSGGV